MAEFIISDSTFSSIQKFGYCECLGEVIRCRDCTQLGCCNDEPWCTFCGIRTKPDNFCAWAVRKDG